MHEKAEELTAIVKVMRELHVAEAFGVKLNPIPQEPVPPRRLSMEEQDKLEEDRKFQKLKRLLGGTPTPEAFEKFKRIL